MKIMTTATIISTLFIAMNVHAESRRAGSEDVTYKLKLQMRQLMQERDAEKSKNKILEKEISKLKKEVENNKKKEKKLKSKLGKTAERGKELAERLQGSFDKLRDSYEKTRELQINLNSTTTERDKARGELQHCMAMNVKLYEAGVEVVSLYEKEASLKVEPVFKLKAVEIENQVQDYKFKMEDFTLRTSTESNSLNLGSTKSDN